MYDRTDHLEIQQNQWATAGLNLRLEALNLSQEVPFSPSQNLWEKVGNHSRKRIVKRRGTENAGHREQGTLLISHRLQRMKLGNRKHFALNKVQNSENWKVRTALVLEHGTISISQGKWKIKFRM